MPEVSPEPESASAESTEPSEEPTEPSGEPAAPLNRAERRAQRRGKKPPLPAGGGQSGPVDRRKPVVVQRRSGRRGNR